MNILVTGGSGFLGSHIIDQLVLMGHNVTSYDIVKSNYKNESFKEIIGNLENKNSLQAALNGIEIIYHLGALPDITVSETNPIKTIESNVIGTLNLVEAALNKKIKKIIFASTIYVNSNKGSFYRISKQTCESIFFEYNRLHNLKYTILRFGTLWGPRSNQSNSIYNYLSQAANTNKVNVKGSGEEIREYIHINDAAEIATKMLNEDTNNLIYILTGHHQTKLKDLMETIREISDKDLEINYLGDNVSNYIRTPYKYINNEGKKIILNTYQDTGSGLLSLYTEIKNELPK